ncbi:MAG: hypothetical protein HY913_02755 [Desulfomonile tiedjei]|nr:hypothetical protein [Desulfomonile tiedjei]
MGLRIFDFFGFSPDDASAEAVRFRENQECPFIGGPCTKLFRDGQLAGSCTFRQASGDVVISCPNRLYAENYRILSDVAEAAFGKRVKMVPANEAVARSQAGEVLGVFGKRWGRELRLPSRSKAGAGRYFVDWILALVIHARLTGFTAIEVQGIDTTGTYRAERDAYLRREPFTGYSDAGLNWENVSKRILPQIIYKGHVLRRESLCQKGMFFVCPRPVFERILERLGGSLLDYTMQPGSLTFMWYDVDAKPSKGKPRPLKLCGQKTTTVDQVANAFTAPSNLPSAEVYAEAIRAELERLR